MSFWSRNSVFACFSSNYCSLHGIWHILYRKGKKRAEIVFSVRNFDFCECFGTCLKSYKCHAIQCFFHFLQSILSFLVFCADIFLFSNHVEFRWNITFCICFYTFFAVMEKNVQKQCFCFKNSISCHILKKRAGVVIFVFVQITAVCMGFNTFCIEKV